MAGWRWGWLRTFFIAQFRFLKGFIKENKLWIARVETQRLRFIVNQFSSYTMPADAQTLYLPQRQTAGVTCNVQCASKRQDDTLVIFSFSLNGLRHWEKFEKTFLLRGRSSAEISFKHRQSLTLGSDIRCDFQLRRTSGLFLKRVA